MSAKEQEIMEKYGISCKESKIYVYRGYKYDKLEDAINYAIANKDKAEDEQVK